MEPKNMKKALKLHVICIISNNDSHSVTKNFTTLYFFPFKLYPHKKKHHIGSPSQQLQLPTQIAYCNQPNLEQWLLLKV
jgi:hypothetical protein